LSLFNPPEEAIEGPLESQEHILQDLTVHLPIFFPEVFDLGQVPFLPIVGNIPYALVGDHRDGDHLACLSVYPELRSLVLLIGILPFREGRVL
jgi:hypothetical protein